MNAEPLDRLISPKLQPATALLALFSDESAPLRDSAHGVLIPMLNRCERQYRSWARKNLKNHTIGEARAIRLAAIGGGGVEIGLRLKLWAVSRTYAATPAGELAVVHQANPADNFWNIRPEHLAAVSRNLARRRKVVPVRSPEPIVLRDQEAA